jgi:hypothetical protein
MSRHFKPADRMRLGKPYDPGPHFHPASELHDREEGNAVVVVGNAWSLHDMPLEFLEPFKTLGCNRCLREDFVLKKPPDYYVCVDRDPYAQMRGHLADYRGVPVLSHMLFDPNNMHKKVPYRTQWAPQQPLPDFDWYGFRPVSSSRARLTGSRSVYTRWPDRARTMSSGMIPAFGIDLDMLIAHGANVGYAMFQIAAALGARVIGIAGIDLEWIGRKTHAFGDGDGKKAGAFALNARFTHPFFNAGWRECKRLGVEVYNLSPTGKLTPPIPRISLEEFHRRFARYATGHLLRARQQQQPGLDKHAGSGKQRHPDYRYKSSASHNRKPVAAAGRPGRSGRRIGQAEARRKHAAALRAARRAAGGAEENAGDRG